MPSSADPSPPPTKTWTAAAPTAAPPPVLDTSTLVKAAPRRIAPDSSRIPTLNRPSTAAVGTIVWLTSELMFFAGVFGIFFTAKAVNILGWPPPGIPLHLPYGVGLTAVAVTSSVICQFGVSAASRGDTGAMRRWYLLTALLGVLFLTGQIAQYRTFLEGGFGVGSSAYSTVFFVLTGFHLIHVVVAGIALAVTATRSGGGTFTPARATRAVVMGYFWQFLTVLWLGVFAAIYLIR